MFFICLVYRFLFLLIFGKCLFMRFNIRYRKMIMLFIESCNSKIYFDISLRTVRKLVRNLLTVLVNGHRWHEYRPFIWKIYSFEGLNMIHSIITVILTIMLCTHLVISSVVFDTEAITLFCCALLTSHRLKDGLLLVEWNYWLCELWTDIKKAEFYVCIEIH